MGKEISTFSDIQIEKYKLYYYKSLTSQKVDLTRFLLVKEIINNLLVTCMMIIKLNHYT